MAHTSEFRTYLLLTGGPTQFKTSHLAPAEDRTPDTGSRDQMSTTTPRWLVMIQALFGSLDLLWNFNLKYIQVEEALSKSFQ